MLRTITLALAAALSPGCCVSEPGDSSEGSSDAQTFDTAISAQTSGASTGLDVESDGEPSSAGSTDSTGGTISQCGNGIVEPGEHCDGAPIAGVECPKTCAFEPGFTLWTTTFDGDENDGPEGGADHPYALAISGEGTVVVGELGRPSYGTDALVALLSPEGEVSWVSAHLADPTHPGQHRAHDVLLDTATAVVSGVAFRSPWVGRFDLGSGSVVWAEIIPVAPGGLDDQIVAGGVGRLDDGRLLVVGSGSLGYEEPGFVAVYEASGMIADLQSFGGPQYSPGYSQFGGIGLAVAAEDAFVVTGAAFTVGGDAWMHGRTLRGDVLWEVAGDDVGKAEGSWFRPAAVAADGTITVAMNRASERADDDVWVGKYSPDGELIWSDVWVGPHGRNDYPAGVAVDQGGRVFVHATISDDAAGSAALRNYDMVILAYSADGSSRWEDVYSGDGMGGGAYSWDYARDIAVDPQGFVVVTGSTMTPTNDYDVLVRLVAP